MFDPRPVEEKSPLDAKLRAFIAINSPQAWRDGLDEWLRLERRRFSNEFARWNSPEKMHLTLRFLGTVTQANILSISESLDEMLQKRPGLTIGFGALGCFPNAERPRVFWLGISGETEKLAGIHDVVRQSTRSFGEPPEDRPFTPHLTLARINKPNRVDKRTLRDLIEVQGVPKLPRWRVTEIELIRSVLGKDGSTYSRLAAFKLGG